MAPPPPLPDDVPVMTDPRRSWSRPSADTPPPTRRPAHVFATGTTKFIVERPVTTRSSGAPAATMLSGRGGDDCLFGFWGEDLLKGGTGEDLLVGASGGDRLNGDAGDDDSAAAAATTTSHRVPEMTWRTPGRRRHDLGPRPTRDTIDCGGGVDKVTADRTDVSRTREYVKRTNAAASDTSVRRPQAGPSWRVRGLKPQRRRVDTVRTAPGGLPRALPRCVGGRYERSRAA